MIQIHPNQPEGIVEFSASGKVTAADYESELMPAIEAALQQNDGVRVLAHFGPAFEGYDLGGMIDDAKLGLRHWRGFERIALVTDVKWMRHAVAGFGVAIPCPIKTFSNDDIESARLFLRESLGTVHLKFDDAANTVTIRLIGKLEPQAYRGVEAELDGWIDGRNRIRLLMDLREFDGWQGLGAMGEHLAIVRDHRRLPERVAIVGDSMLQKVAARIMTRFLRAEVRYFESTAIEQAGTWVRG